MYNMESAPARKYNPPSWAIALVVKLLNLLATNFPEIITFVQALVDDTRVSDHIHHLRPLIEPFLPSLLKSNQPSIRKLAESLEKFKPAPVLAAKYVTRSIDNWISDDDSD